MMTTQCNHLWRAVDSRRSQCAKCGEITKAPCREPECEALRAELTAANRECDVREERERGYLARAQSAEAQLAECEQARDELVKRAERLESVIRDAALPAIYHACCSVSIYGDQPPKIYTVAADKLCSVLEERDALEEE